MLGVVFIGSEMEGGFFASVASVKTVDSISVLGLRSGLGFVCSITHFCPWGAYTCIESIEISSRRHNYTPSQSVPHLPKWI